MFFPSDPVTEIVAHFLGYFEVAVEAMRTRLSYEQIESELPVDPLDPALEQVAAEISQKFSLGAYQPGVDYTPPEWSIRGEAPIVGVAAPSPITVVDVPAPLQAAAAPGQLPTPEMPPVPMVGEEPGSVGAVIAQVISLSDNDVVILGAYEGELMFHSGAAEGILMMHAAASSITDSVTEAVQFHGQQDVAPFIAHVAEAIDALADQPPPDTTVHEVESLEGVYVNGEKVTEGPELTEALPSHWREAVEGNDGDLGPQSTEQVSLTGQADGGSVTLEAGGNLLVNQAAVFNAGMTAAVFAVDGDLHQLDVIIQTNAYVDADSIDSGTPGQAASPGETAAYNTAVFGREVRDATADAAEVNPGAMPGNWQVSVVAGDLMFIEWLTQYTFQSDQDISVLSSSGNDTLVTTGENVGLNGVSFVNIGLYYDLVIVGGNLYDANVIVQTNVLYDNDTIQMLGEGSSGTGSVATGGNLLWNQAAIHNIGPTEFEHGMPDHYQEAMSRLDSGEMAMPGGFSRDSLFEGFHVLKVLYIAGDLYDLRYIEQTNVLGDADLVALHKSSVQEGLAETDWTIQTGANALINIATIQDHDGLDDTAFVGGEVYSDAILIQADIIADSSSEPGSDALVTEVIAFLEVDTGAPAAGGDDLGPTPLPADGPPADIMQSALA